MDQGLWRAQRGGATPLAECAYQRIRRAIVTLEWQPGDYVLDREIAALVGSSRTPIREALARLEAEGWIEFVPRRGCRILPVDYRELMVIGEIVAGMETEGAVATAASRDWRRIADLKSLTDKIGELSVESDLVRVAELDTQFHRLLVAQRNVGKLTWSIYGMLTNQLERALLIHPGTEGSRDQHISEHGLLLMALDIGDQSAAGLIARGHRMRMVERICAQCPKPQEESVGEAQER